MNFKRLMLATVISSMCSIASADKNPNLPKMKTAAQHGKQNNSAIRSEDKADEQRAAELKREEIDLLHQAEAKHEQAKALIQQEKALRNQELTQEHAEKVDKKDRGALKGEVKQEGNERSQLNRQADQLEKEREALTRQANEKASERKAIAAQIRANNGHKN
jgi:hypothetical protein